MENKWQTLSGSQNKELIAYIKQDSELRLTYGPLGTGLQKTLHYAREKILFWAFEVMEKIGLSLRSIELFVFILEIYWIKNQISIPKSDLQKLALSSLYLVIKEVEKEDISIEDLNYMCKNAYSNEAITEQIERLSQLFPRIHIIVTPSVLLPAFKVPIDEEDYKTASVFIYQTYENVTCLNCSEILFVTLRFIQTSPLISNKTDEDEENLKGIISQLTSFITSSLQGLEQIVEQINAFVEQHEQTEDIQQQISSEDLNNPIELFEEIRSRGRKMSLESTDFTLLYNKENGVESEQLNEEHHYDVDKIFEQENENNLSIEHEIIKTNCIYNINMNSNNNNNNNNNNQIHTQLPLKYFSQNSLNKQQSKQDEMEKPHSTSEYLNLQDLSNHFDSEIFIESDQKPADISNVSTSTPLNSNYNSNNNNNNLQINYNSPNNQCNVPTLSYQSQIQSNSHPLITFKQTSQTSSSSSQQQQQQQYNSNNSIF